MRSTSIVSAVLATMPLAAYALPSTQPRRSSSARSYTTRNPHELSGDDVPGRPHGRRSGTPDGLLPRFVPHMDHHQRVSSLPINPLTSSVDVWVIDADVECDCSTCNTRETVLKRDGTNVVVTSACVASSGTWYSPYDGATWTAASDVG